MNKKINIFMLIITAFALSIMFRAGTVQASEVDSNGIYYELNSSGTYTITRYDASETKVTVPDTFNGKKVTTLSDDAFRMTNITNITLGKNVTKLGIASFAYCTDLNSVTINGKVKAIPMECFYSCTSLKKITLPASCKKIGYNAFAECTSMYQIVIPKSVTSIASSAFYQCKTSKLTIVTKTSSTAYKYAVKKEFMTSTSTAIKISDKTLKMLPKGSTKLYLYNHVAKVTWKSSNSSVAKVNAYGKLTAKKKGTTTITATSNGKKYTCKITIIKRSSSSVLNAIYTQYVTKDMTDYEKIYAAHAWLIKNVKYDKRLYTKGYIPMVSHTAKGALNKGIAVCDGYAKAFMIIMDHYNIPCKMITGGQHAWNLVKIKNKWYHIDCTYDDPIVNWSFLNTHVYTTYFLKTDAFMAKDHTWNRSAFPKCTSTKINKTYRSK